MKNKDGVKAGIDSYVKLVKPRRKWTLNRLLPFLFKTEKRMLATLIYSYYCPAVLKNIYRFPIILIAGTQPVAKNLVSVRGYVTSLAGVQPINNLGLFFEKDRYGEVKEIVNSISHPDLSNTEEEPIINLLGKLWPKSMTLKGHSNAPALIPHGFFNSPNVYFSVDSVYSGMSVSETLLRFFLLYFENRHKYDMFYHTIEGATGLKPKTLMEIL